MVDRVKTVAVAVLTLLGAISLPGPAAATGTIFCDGATDNSVAVQIGIGRVPVLAVLNARIAAGSAVYANDVEATPGAVPIVFGQGVFDEDRLRVDFTDPNVERIVVSLRIERAFEGKSGAEAGVLRIDGEGAWAVVCEIG